MPGGDSNAQSTAWAVQGLVAAGLGAGSTRGMRRAIGYLKSLQAADGSVRYSRTSRQTPVWVTAQALAALAGKPFPLRPAPRRRAGVRSAAAVVRPRPAGPGWIVAAAIAMLAGALAYAAVRHRARSA
jgi:hypothetical protein